ncbi:MAG: Asp-tRNA(Asn)/Glu-tRNA(Gln) amidotransferase subunit GatC [Archaeoglobaceae archaeon]|nr:Asp-tRNA(Asn)/Glu-tRNA(Gln) amidotransferase subunit GatC [Archaeoglobaceae archaeon]MDW7990269.1 Asp-tRNA(Asn)/Glu-tRNA(Gln) amidotransferase subunit GatC [Archaeoglobaceae archaeon]
MVSVEEVYYVSKLAKLSISEEEVEKFRKDFEEILSYFDILDEIEENIKPTFHVLEISNIFREDFERESIKQNKVLLNAPRREEGYFIGPKVVE